MNRTERPPRACARPGTRDPLASRGRTHRRGAEPSRTPPLGLRGELTQSVIDKLGDDAERLVKIPQTDLQVAAKVAGRLVSSLDALGRKRQWGTVNVDSRTLDRTRRAIGDFVVETLNRTVDGSAASMAAITANPAMASSPALRPYLDAELVGHAGMAVCCRCCRCA